MISWVRINDIDLLNYVDNVVYYIINILYK